MHRRSPLLPFLVVLTLVIAACSSSGSSSSSPATTGAPMGGSGAIASGDPMASPGADSFDQAFIDMMVPHHQSAIEMAKVAQDRAERAEIKTLAGDIISAQTVEIDQLRSWRKLWFGSDQTPGMEAMPMLPGMDMGGMGGMSMDMTADVEALKKAAPFDKAFIEAMTEHHRMAIEAAKLAQANATQSEIKNMAGEIIAAQEAEISEMAKWLAAWY